MPSPYAIDESRWDAFHRHLTTNDAPVQSFLEIGAPAMWRPERGEAPDADTDPHLAGVPLAVKDNIAVAGYRLTCGSRMLEELVSPYSATAVERLLSAGALVVGKTNLDEFGMGSSCDNSALGRTNNPWDHARVAGGSSGGSAAAVAAGLVPLAIGSDTGGSIRQPAAFCGVYGLKPTYGAVSRYGLVAYASSLEVIGALGRTVELVRSAFRVMRGIDPRDQSSADAAAGATPVTQVSTDAPIGVLEGDLGLSREVEKNYRETVDRFRSLGYRTEPVSLSTLEYVVPAYYTIAAAEASANLARFNGVRYGYRPIYAENPEELMRKARSEAFGDEVKLRIVLGTYVLRSGFQDQFYVRAQKIRTLIRNELDALFTRLQALLLPVFPTQAFAHDAAEMTPFQQKVADRFTGIANLAALPALSVPTGVEAGLPVGMQLMGPRFGEERLFDLAERLAAEVPPVLPPGVTPFEGED